MVFLDTSAIYALADRNDDNHKVAKGIFKNVLTHESILVHNYIIVESAALIQSRLGLTPAKKFLQDVSKFEVIWVDAFLHNKAVEYLFSKGNRGLSFVDCISFVVMRNNGISKAIVFDEDFLRAGFEILKAPNS